MFPTPRSAPSESRQWPPSSPAACGQRCDNGRDLNLEVFPILPSHLTHRRLFSAILLLVVFCFLPVLGCRAQNNAGKALSPQESRKITLLVRSKLNVPPNWQVEAGPRTPSDMPGYDKINIEFYPEGEPAKKQPIEFLLSNDGKTLARLSKYDLADLPSMHIDTTARPVRGNKNAKVEIINFDDLECPFCARMHAELFPQTLDHYKGLIKIVYKDDPLVEIHPWAMHAAVNAECLAAQNGQAYWSYVDYLHTHGEDVTGPDRDAKKSDAMLDKLAREQGLRSKLDTAKLDSCITKQDESLVRTSMKEAASLDIDGTPTLFINGERLTGAQPLPALWSAIDRALKASGVNPPPNTAAQSAPPQTGN